MLGITLIEMLLGLLIIGGLLGIVMVGIELQHNAQNKKIARVFIGGWVQAYDLYHERTGRVPGDPSNTGRTHVPLEAAFETQFSGIVMQLPQGDGEGGINSYRYNDEQGYIHHLRLAFESISTASEAIGVGLVGNVMRLEGVSPTLFATLEALLDESLSRTQGTLRCRSILEMDQQDPMRQRNKSQANHSFVCWYKMRY